MKSNTDVSFWRELKASRPMLTKQHTEHPVVRRADTIPLGIGSIAQLKDRRLREMSWLQEKVCREFSIGGMAECE